LTNTTLDTTVGSLVRARGREWVVLPGTTPDFLLLQPLGGSSDDVVGVFPDEGVEPATFPAPSLDDLSDATSTDLLRTALRVGFQSSAGPFRSLAGITVSPRNYQYVPLMMALRQDTVRLLIADDVGIGKTIEAALIASELLAQGTVKRLAVLCSPALAEQWQRELRDKFGIDAALVPDFVPVWGRDGTSVAGYIPKAYLLGSSMPTVTSSRPEGDIAPVYADDLTTLVGHMYPDRGFVPLGVDPNSIPTIPVQQGPPSSGAP